MGGGGGGGKALFLRPLTLISPTFLLHYTSSITTAVATERGGFFMRVVSLPFFLLPYIEGTSVRKSMRGARMLVKDGKGGICEVGRRGRVLAQDFLRLGPNYYFFFLFLTSQEDPFEYFSETFQGIFPSSRSALYNNIMMLKVRNTLSPRNPTACSSLL